MENSKSEAIFIFEVSTILWSSSGIIPDDCYKIAETSKINMVSLFGIKLLLLVFWSRKISSHFFNIFCTTLVTTSIT